jgi:hypothetical protein
LLSFLPPMPDAATLETMAWWAGTCALVALGGWGIARIANSRSPFAGPRDREPPPVEVPGYTPPGADDDRWTTLRSGLRYTLAGAFGGAMMGWLTATPESLDPGLDFLFETLGVVAAAIMLIRVMRDRPAVGEAPPDDPDDTVAARLPGAILQLTAAALFALIALATLM